MSKLRLAAVVLAVFLLGPGAAGALDAPGIVGAPKCKICHGAKTGDQFRIWSESAHAGAFVTLGTDEAQAVAAERGLGDPQTEPACLRCHTTQAFLGPDAAVDATGKYEVSEGVGCESCHGAGSEYKSKKVMEDRAAAVAAGLVIPDEATCRKCHNEESPFFTGFDFATYWEKIRHPVPAKE